MIFRLCVFFCAFFFVLCVCCCLSLHFHRDKKSFHTGITISSCSVFYLFCWFFLRVRLSVLLSNCTVYSTVIQPSKSRLFWLVSICSVSCCCCDYCYCFCLESVAGCNEHWAVLVCDRCAPRDCSWSVIYFLMTSATVASNTAWVRITHDSDSVQ